MIKLQAKKIVKLKDLKKLVIKLINQKHSLKQVLKEAQEKALRDLNHLLLNK